jgi:hypothetical protein
MSAVREQPHPELDAEQEVDLGRYWGAFAARWWLAIIGLVVGLVAGILATTGGSRPFQARGVVFLGQPTGPDRGLLQNLPVRWAMLEETLRSRAFVNEVGPRVGIRPEVLRRSVEIEAVFVERGQTRLEPLSPLIAVLVTHDSAAVASRAVVEISGRIVRGYSSYVDLKLQNYQARRRRAERELVQVNANLVAAERRQGSLQSNSAGLDPAAQLILLANLNNTLQFNESRQANLEGALLSLKELIAHAELIERARVIEPPEATRVPGPSKRTAAVVGALIGLIVGAFAALFWEPVARRVRARPSG